MGGTNRKLEWLGHLKKEGTENIRPVEEMMLKMVGNGTKRSLQMKEE